jgi:hypothetical protein
MVLRDARVVRVVSFVRTVRVVGKVTDRMRRR